MEDDVEPVPLGSVELEPADADVSVAAEPALAGSISLMPGLAPTGFVASVVADVGFGGSTLVFPVARKSGVSRAALGDTVFVSAFFTSAGCVSAGFWTLEGGDPAGLDASAAPGLAAADGGDEAGLTGSGFVSDFVCPAIGTVALPASRLLESGLLSPPVGALVPD